MDEINPFAIVVEMNKQMTKKHTPIASTQKLYNNYQQTMEKVLIKAI